MIQYISSSPEETFKIAKNFAKKIKSGDIIALDGELGSGKTVFVKGVAFALEINDYITSPTFNIVKEYVGTKKLYHFDVYRIDDVDELFEIGFDEYLNDDAICIIEWANMIEEALPQNVIHVKIEGSGHDNRILTIDGGEF